VAVQRPAEHERAHDPGERDGDRPRCDEPRRAAACVQAQEERDGEPRGQERQRITRVAAQGEVALVREQPDRYEDADRRGVEPRGDPRP
jgi:hypothetical protein